MTPHSASIQSYFAPVTSISSDPPEVPSSPLTLDAPEELGDGFTEEERRVKTRLLSAHTVWVPQQEYEDVEISDLVSGPGCRTFMGRVVNFYDRTSNSKSPRAAKGCMQIIVKDDTGVMTIRLWYAKAPPTLRLGQLVTVWTPFISNGEHGNLAPSNAPIFTTIFPERDRGCHIMYHEQSDDGTLCKAPLEYKPGRALSNLMTLQNFSDGGYDIVNGRILVVVKWIAAKKTVLVGKGEKQEMKDLINAGLFDDTAEAQMTLWGPMCASASTWKAAQTVLLITNPGWKMVRKTNISLTQSTMIEVDPETEDTTWLRGFAARLTRRDHVNPEFPNDMFDFEALTHAQLKIKYTLADLDEFARAAPRERFMGYMSVLLTELDLIQIQRRNMLMCNECCGIPIYANAISTKCKQCDKQVNLRVNPKVLGPLVDETGSTTCGKIILSDHAWEQLFGRSARDLVKLSPNALRHIEQRLLFLRTTLVFGWVAEEPDTGVGRICVWEVLS